MSGINQSAYVQAVASQQSTTTSTVANDKKANSLDGKKAIRGAGTYGNPKLSSRAEEYYKQLKQKYGKLNFVLVSADKKQEADAMKGSFARAGSLTVLIDTDKIERMAEDENYRKQIETTISNASSGLSQLTAQMGNTSNVKAYGMTIDKTGNASYFAVVDKSLEAQKKRIEKKATEKREAKKEESKKAAKEAAKKRIEDGGKTSKTKGEDTVTITANSVEELMQKIKDYEMDFYTDNIMTKEETTVGQSVDFKL